MRALASMSLGLALALGLCCSTARADRVTRLAYSLDADDVVLRVDADMPLGSPRMHLDAGAVRLWFTGVGQGRFIERHGDGRAIRRVSARPGAANTALVVLDLGDGRRLLPEDVRVVLDGTSAVVRVGRSVLPGAAAMPAPSPPAAVTPTAPSPPAAATPTMLDAVVPIPAAVAVPIEAPAAPAAPAPSRMEAPSPMAGFAHAIPDAKSAGLQTVGMVVALLLGLALFGRWLRQKRAARPAAAIRVVASHRLGAKHQLVVVRAFDQEILLSVNGGETRRIASRRAGEEAEAVPMKGESAGSDARVASAGRLLALVPAAKPEMERSSRVRPSPRDDEPAETSSPFGAELARLVRGIAPSPTASRPVLSESVSGLVRLREAKAQR